MTIAILPNKNEALNIPPETMKARIKALQDRFSHACEAAQAMGKGHIDHPSLEKYFELYFADRVIRPLRIYDLEEQREIVRTNWIGMQIDANIQLIRHKREEYCGNRLRLMFTNAGTDDHMISGAEPNETIAAEIEENCLSMLEEIAEITGIERNDLRNELRMAMEHDYTPLLKDIKNEGAFNRFAIARGTRQFQAFYDAANSLISTIEAEMGVFARLHKMRINNARRNTQTLADLNQDLTDIAQECLACLSDAPEFFETAARSAEMMPAIIATTQARTQQAATGHGLYLN